MPPSRFELEPLLAGDFWNEAVVLALDLLAEEREEVKEETDDCELPDMELDWENSPLEVLDWDSWEDWDWVKGADMNRLGGTAKFDRDPKVLLRMLPKGSL